MKSFLKYTLIIFVALSINSCKKDDGADPGIGGQSGSTITASFSGFVKDDQGNGLSGAFVTIGGSTAITNSSGGFKIQNASVNKKRAIVEVNKSGYLKQQKCLIAENGTINHVDLMLFPDNKAYTVNAVSGGIISLSGGTKINFPANAFVTSTGSSYNGTVYLTAHEILTSDSNFSAKIPGGDLMAIDSSGNETLLLSYGMAGAELYDAAGNKLQLAPGKTALVKFPISPMQTGSALGSIPLWHYDESDKMWKEEGTATRNGNFYEGTVSHFSWWNCDQPCQYATLNVTITGCTTLPLVDERIEIIWNGQARTGRTNSSGNCSGAIPANALLTVNCYNVYGILDTSFTIGPYVHQSTQSVQFQLFTNCNTAQINLADCSGTPVNGIVKMYYNGSLISSLPTIGSNALIPGLNQGTYVFEATNGIMGGSGTLIVNSIVSTSYVLNMQLCDTMVNSSIGTVSMQILIGPSTVVRYLSVLDCNVQGTNILMECFDSLNSEEWSITLNNSNYTPNAYAWSFLTGEGVVMFNIGTSSSYSYSPNSGSTSLFQCPPPGGTISGAFSGSMTMEDNLFNLTGVSVTAIFDAIRTQ